MDLASEETHKRLLQNASSSSSLFVRDISYDEWLLVDVVQIQRQDIIFAAHIHAVVVLIHAKDAIVGRVQQKGEVVSSAGRLQLWK